MGNPRFRCVCSQTSPSAEAPKFVRSCSKFDSGPYCLVHNISCKSQILEQLRFSSPKDPSKMHIINRVPHSFKSRMVSYSLYTSGIPGRNLPPQNWIQIRHLIWPGLGFHCVHRHICVYIETYMYVLTYTEHPALNSILKKIWMRQ